jgi:hypothetical protein
MKNVLITVTGLLVIFWLDGSCQGGCLVKRVRRDKATHSKEGNWFAHSDLAHFPNRYNGFSCNSGRSEYKKMNKDPASNGAF